MDEHHPEPKHAQQVETQAKTDQMDASVQEMRAMREKIWMEKNPEAREALMQKHMQMMMKDMNMMSMMGGMMEKKMMMQQEMKAK